MTFFTKQALFISTFCLGFVLGTWRYYGAYQSYGTGDTFVTTYHNHGGTNSARHKWILECLDGEAMVAIQDWQNDYERIEAIACKFMFPYKPSSGGLYPYYSTCHVRNYTVNAFCYDATRSELTVNTFVTGIWDNDQNWWTYRPGPDDVQPYKCCKTPPGYYIDYVSCYYVPTHDPYWEYYDSFNNYIVTCATGYVMTGMFKKLSPITLLYNVDYIQCCRVGFGAPVAFAPPVVHSQSGSPSYVARSLIEAPVVPPDYHAQYRSPQNNCKASQCISKQTLDNSTLVPEIDFWSARYAPAKLSKQQELEHSQFDSLPLSKGLQSQFKIQEEKS